MTAPLPEASADGTPWQGGWLRHAQPLPSPNHGPRPPGAAIDLLVVHSISLPPGEFGTGAVQQLFTNQLDWDAHPYFQSIRGLEVSAHFFITRSGQLWQFVDCERRAWHAGVSSYRGRERCNDDSIGIELEGLEGSGFEAAQYACLATGRKHDPGSGFSWGYLQQALAWPIERFPAKVLQNS
jgi:AmpD protein